MNNVIYDSLQAYRFPKTHDFTIQECRILDVREVVCFFSAEQYSKQNYARLESSDILLEARKCGAARRWFFLCPKCSTPCEYLYVPPTESIQPADSLYDPPRADWRCRGCWNLSYASQKFGRTNALRRQLPPRRAL